MTESPTPFAYRSEDLEPDTENNPDSDAGLNRERVRKSQQAAHRIEIAMTATIIIGIALLFAATIFAPPARFDQILNYEKIVLVFVVGLFVGARLVAPA